MTSQFSGKRLLLLGGSKPYLKVAKAAKRLGAYVIIVDRNASEEVLAICDEYIKYSLLDIDGISAWCRQNEVDGIINYCVDFAQRTYWELCNTFGLPCLYDKKQVDTLANKSKFKELLSDSGLDIIHSYNEQDVLDEKAIYPIIIKPSESSGSRGATICYDKASAVSGIALAKSESRSGDIIIEEFIRDSQEVQITFFLINGQVFVIRTADSYTGKESDNLDHVVACSISPSRYTEEYLRNTHNSVLKLVNRLNLHDGPFFMQGFFHEGKFKFFDPGCRFPGVDFDSVYIQEYGVDLAEYMVAFALSGHMPLNLPPENMYNLNNKKAAVLFPVLKEGVISGIEGMEELSSNPHVFSISQRHRIGDHISFTYNVDQRFGEIDLLANDLEELKDQVRIVQATLKVNDTNGEEMIYSHFDVRRFVNTDPFQSIC